MKSDKFGNLLTNVASEDLPADRANLAIELGNLRITRFCRYYAEAPKGELFAIIGSSGLLEISTNCGSAEEQTGIAAGAKFR